MGALFTKIGAWLAGFVGIKAFDVTNRFAFLGILITMFIGLYVAFMATIVGLFSFVPVEPTGNVAAGLSMLPSNVGQCMTAIAAAHVAAHVFIMKMKIIKLSSKA
ncbi:DUF5455 family protein [Photobacterium angustum]|uniref:DUF5455 family protein n=1 Tax=Photobacterium angustum TaxID=661 RepID=UPI0005E30981|nr:DUF5455 family protein [Photobacterium angustum]KJF95129.1 hypothetical protein UB39_07105 [Photobacterium angustum]PSW81189.1 hypothetical protein CTN03_08755 [Photobacterium angustum]